MNKKYKGRSKNFFANGKIICPKHGYQRVYALVEKNKKKSIGCNKCFKHLPIIENI